MTEREILMLNALRRIAGLTGAGYSAGAAAIPIAVDTLAVVSAPDPPAPSAPRQ